MSLDEKPVVELESVDYILCNRQSVSLSELPEWWYSNTMSCHSEHNGYRESDDNFDRDLPAEIDSFQEDCKSHDDDEEIKIVNTFSLAPDASLSSPRKETLKRKLQYVTPSDGGGKLVKYDEVDGVIFTSFRSKNVVKCFDEAINEIEENYRFWSFFQLMSTYKAQVKSGKQPVLKKVLKSSRKGKGFRGVTSKIRKFDRRLEMKLVHNGIVASNEIRKEVPHDVSSSCSKEVQNLSELSPPPVDIQLIKQEEIIPEEYFSNTSILLDKEPMTVESSSNSIFCSQELDEFLNSETKNLLDKPFFKVEKLKPVYSDVKYNTPAAQSSYIKTLESALHHVRAARNDESCDQLLIYPHTDQVHTDINESSVTVSLLGGTSSSRSRESPRKSRLFDYSEKLYPMKLRLQPSKFHLVRKTKIPIGSRSSVCSQESMDTEEKDAEMEPLKFHKVPFLPAITPDRARHAVLAVQPQDPCRDDENNGSNISISSDLLLDFPIQDSSFATPEQSISSLDDQDEATLHMSSTSKDDCITNNAAEHESTSNSKEANVGGDSSLNKLQSKILVQRLVNRLGKTKVRKLRRKVVYASDLEKVAMSLNDKDIECWLKCARSLVYNRKSPGTCECGDHYRWKCFSRRSKHKKHSLSKESHHSSKKEWKKHDHSIGQSKTFPQKEDHGLNQLFNAEVASSNYVHKNFFLSKSSIDHTGKCITKVFKIMSRCSGWVFNDVLIAMFKLDHNIRKKQFQGCAGKVLNEKYSIVMLVKANDKKESKLCLPDYILKNLHNEECTTSLACIHKTKSGTSLPKKEDEGIVYYSSPYKSIQNLLEMEKYAFENTESNTTAKREVETKKDSERLREPLEIKVAKSKLVMNAAVPDLDVTYEEVIDMESSDSSLIRIGSEANEFKKHYSSELTGNSVLDLTGTDDPEMEPEPGTFEERNGIPEQDNGFPFDTSFLNSERNDSLFRELSTSISFGSSTPVPEELVAQNHIHEPFMTKKIVLDPNNCMGKSFDFTSFSVDKSSTNVSEEPQGNLKQYEIIMNSSAVCVFPSSPDHSLETEIVSSPHLLPSIAEPETSTCSNQSNIGDDSDTFESSSSFDGDSSKNSQEQFILDSVDNPTSSKVNNIELNSAQSPLNVSESQSNRDFSITNCSSAELTVATPPKESVLTISENPDVIPVSTSTAPISHVEYDAIKINLHTLVTCARNSKVFPPSLKYILPKSTTSSPPVVQRLPMDTQLQHADMSGPSIIAAGSSNASRLTDPSVLNLSLPAVKDLATTRRCKISAIEGHAPASIPNLTTVRTDQSPLPASIIIIPHSKFVSDVKNNLKEQPKNLNVFKPGQNLYLQKVPVNSLPLFPIWRKKPLAKKTADKSTGMSVPVATIAPSISGKVSLADKGKEKNVAHPHFSPSLSTWLSQDGTKKIDQEEVVSLTSAPFQTGNSSNCASATSTLQVTDATDLSFNDNEDPMLSESFRNNMRLFMPSFFSVANSQLDTFVGSQSTDVLQNQCDNVTTANVGFPNSPEYATFSGANASSKPVVSLGDIIIPSAVISQAETSSAIRNEKCRSTSTITTPIASTFLSGNESTHQNKTFRQYKDITSVFSTSRCSSSKGKFQILAPDFASPNSTKKGKECNECSRNISEDLLQNLEDAAFEQIEVEEIESFLLDSEQTAQKKTWNCKANCKQKIVTGLTKATQSKTNKFGKDNLSDIEVTGLAAHNSPSNVELLNQLSPPEPEKIKADDSEFSESLNCQVERTQCPVCENERGTKNGKEKHRRFKLSESVNKLRLLIGQGFTQSKHQVILEAIEECNKMRREEKFLLDYKVQLQEEHMKLTERMKELHSVVFPRVMH